MTYKITLDLQDYDRQFVVCLPGDLPLEGVLNGCDHFRDIVVKHVFGLGEAEAREAVKNMTPPPVILKKEYEG